MGMLFVLRAYFMSAGAEWKAELKNKRFVFKLTTLLASFFLYSSITQHLGNYVEARKGIRLTDSILSIFPSLDWSPQIFMLLYSSMAIIIIANLSKPKVIVRLMEMHLLVAIVRQICILMFALEPPAGIIILQDQFLENTVYPHRPLTKDLFFSGHVASIWIYFLCARQKYLKMTFIGAAVLMSFMLLSMRVHYSYDVYGAIFFTTVIYFMPVWLDGYYIKFRGLFSRSVS